MSWRQSSGKDKCHDCKQPVALGAPVYVGELTPATWCEHCAGSSLKKVLGDAQEVPKFVSVETKLQGMRELVAKFAPKVRPNWGERDE